MEAIKEKSKFYKVKMDETTMNNDGVVEKRPQRKLSETCFNLNLYIKVRAHVLLEVM